MSQTLLHYANILEIVGDIIKVQVPPNLSGKAAVCFGDLALIETPGAASSLAQVIHIQQDRVVPIPKSSKPDNIASNFDIFDFALTDDEMAAISHLSKTHKQRVANPAHLAPEWDD